MYIDRILAPITTLGPGNRLVIWTKGCTKHCANCANPELWSTAGAKNYDVDEILKIIVNVLKQGEITGVTISGGDPLEQKEDILKLVAGLSAHTGDIMVYTGYTMDQLENAWSTEEMDTLKTHVAVLIDGPYIEELNRKDVILRGSANQTIHYFKPEYEAEYTEYMALGRTIQNVMMGDKLISVGIHNRKGEN